MCFWFWALITSKGYYAYLHNPMLFREFQSSVIHDFRRGGVMIIGLWLRVSQTLERGGGSSQQGCFILFPRCDVGEIWRGLCCWQLRERGRILGALAVVIQGDHGELASFLWAGVHHRRGCVRAGQEHGMLRRPGGDAVDGAPAQGQREDVGRPLHRVDVEDWSQRHRIACDKTPLTVSTK